MLKLDKLVLQTQAITEAVKNRKGLVRLCTALKIKAVGRDDRALKVDIIKTVSKDFDPAGRSDVYIQAYYEAILEQLIERERKDTAARAVYYAGSLENDPREIFLRQTAAMADGKPADSVLITDRRLAVVKDNGGRPQLKIIEETRKAPVG